MKNIILIICLLVFNQNVFAQKKNEIDSLIHLASRSKHDSVKLNIYLKICDLCDTKDNLKYGLITNAIAEKLIVQSKSKNEREKFVRKRLIAFNVIGIYYEELKQLDSLEKYKIRSVEVAKSTNNIALIHEQIDNLAEMYRNENEYTKAMNIYTDELKKAEKLNNKEQIIYALIGIRETYVGMHNNKKTLEYSLKILKIEQEGVVDSTKLAYAYFNVGRNYYNLYNNQKAILYYLKSYKILEKKINNRDKSYYLFQLARAYNEQKNSLEARKYFLKALEIVNEIGDSVIIGVVNSEIGQTYFYENKIGKALEYKLKGINLINGKSDGDAFLPYLTTGQIYLKTKQYNFAEKYVSVAKKIAENQKNIHNQKAVMKVLADIYNSKGDVAKSNEYLLKFYQLKDSMDKMRNTEELLYKELNYENEKNEARLVSEQEKKNIETQNQKRKQFMITLFVASLLFIVLVFLFFVFRSLHNTKQQKQTIELKEIETQKQKHLVEEKQKEIIESITYAKRLQEAILPPQEFIDKYIPNNFILYKPKDLVAGDFYWAEKIDNLFFIAAADSTGHGVPGAIVSVVCSNALNRTIKEFNQTETGKILDKTRELVLETFEKSASEVKDGMDISLLCIDCKNRSIFWSGANNPLWYIQGNEIIEIKADKQPIGKTDYPKPFTTHKIEYRPNTTFYLFTDGLADQFGGPNGKKFKYKQFSDLLFKNKDLSQIEQSAIINKAFTEWKGELEQVDDVCVIGVKI